MDTRYTKVGSFKTIVNKIINTVRRNIKKTTIFQFKVQIYKTTIQQLNKQKNPSYFLNIRS